MNRNAIHKIYLLVLALLLASAGTLYAGKKPKITRHDATLLQNAIKITVEWQAEKPVVLLKATVGGESREVELDEFDDNTRDRHGFYGEADVSITLEPYEAFVQKDYIPYVIQIRDDFGRKSEITGRVRVKVTEAEDTYKEEEGRYAGEMPARSSASGEYRTRHIIRDVLDIVKQHTSQPDNRGNRDSDHATRQDDPNLGANAELPVITLLPDPEGYIDVTVEVGKPYKEFGAIVKDSEGKKIAGFEKIGTTYWKRKLTDEGEGEAENVEGIAPDEEGAYYVVYYYPYKGDVLAQAQREVYVVDSTAVPVIILVPDPEGYVELVVPVGKEYKELGAFVEDSESNRIAEFDKLDRSFWKWKLTDEGVYEPEHVEEIATDEAGEYDVVYSYTYAQDKSVEDQRRVYVVHEAAPVITLFPNPDDPDGNTYVTVEVGKSYKEPGYKAVDKDNNDITHKVTVDERVNTDIAREYLVYYDVEDNGIAAEIMRYVYVVPSAAPEDEVIEPPPPEGRGAFGRFPRSGTTKGSKKPLPRIKWKGGRPTTVAETQVAPPKIPPGIISATPQTKKKTRVYYRAKLPPTGSTVNKARSPKVLPDGITLAPGVAQQPAKQPSDDQKKSDVKKMKPLR